MRKSIVALLLLSVVLVLVSCLNKPVIIKPETTTNENNYSVKATEGATYLISSDSIGKQIEIKTDTDWTNASFIIDDSVVEVQENKYYTLPIFSGKNYKICRIPELYPDLTVNYAENNWEQL